MDEYITLRSLSQMIEKPIHDPITNRRFHFQMFHSNLSAHTYGWAIYISSCCLSFFTRLVHVFVPIVQNVVERSTESVPPFSSTLLFLKAGELGLPGLLVTNLLVTLVLVFKYPTRSHWNGLFWLVLQADAAHLGEKGQWQEQEEAGHIVSTLAKQREDRKWRPNFNIHS